MSTKLQFGGIRERSRLSFNRAIILLEQGTEAFSNISGVKQIRFSKDNVRESFGDVLARFSASLLGQKGKSQ